MKSLMRLINGVTYNKTNIQSNGVRILRGGNLTNNNTIEYVENDVFLPTKYVDKENQIQYGDIIIVASTGSTAVIGKPAFVKDSIPNTQIGGFLKIVRPNDEQCLALLWLIFRSTYYHNCILSLVHGVNINNIKAEYLENMLIPIPPCNELHNIWKKYNSLNKFIDTIKKSLI